jgi:RimJ/RimL family protein N-acetyltransferase
MGTFLHAFDSDFTPCTEIGLRLAYEYWGRGYATEAAGAALGYAFDTLGMDEIVLMSRTGNGREIALMERIGLKYVRNIVWPLLPVLHPLRPYVLYKLRRRAERKALQQPQH